ncbi:MAG: PorV/PorQ family protein [bacterium]
MTAGLSLLVFPNFSFADQPDYSSELLSIGVGARPLAMGGAFVAAASDATAAYWNPAGLALIDNVEITTIHATQSSIQNYDFLNVAFNTHGAGTYALSYIRLNVGGIDITGAGGPEVLGEAQATEQAALLSGGWKLGRDLAVGGTLKFLKDDDYTASAFGFGSDIGLIYKPIKELSFGINAQDYTGGTYIQWQGTPTNPTQVLSPNLKLGVSFTKELGKRVSENGTQIPNSTLTADFDVDTRYIDKGLNTYHLGVEYWYRQFVAIRAGVQSNGFQFDSDDLTLSAGVGVWVYLFEFDYAFVDYQISPTHYLSLITRL